MPKTVKQENQKKIIMVETKAPADLLAVLKADPQAKEKWDSLTSIGRRDFISWIESAKQPETRKRRVDSVPSRLASGKRRPCCYAVVPGNLYRAINADPKAKANWKNLTADEKRDFSEWIESAGNKEEKDVRTVKAHSMIAAGKKFK